MNSQFVFGVAVKLMVAPSKAEVALAVMVPLATVATVMVYPDLKEAVMVTSWSGMVNWLFTTGISALPVVTCHASKQ